MSIFPTKILLATDGSLDAQLAVRAAAELNNNTGSELHVVTVGGEYHPGVETAARPELPEETLQELEQEAKETLDEQTVKIGEVGATITRHHLRMGKPAEELVSLAEEIGAGLIAMGSRGLGGMRRLLLGSVSDSVVRHAHCPVLVARKKRR